MWHNRGHCTLTFASLKEATARFKHFVEDLSRWHEIPRLHASQPEAEIETAEHQNFHLTRHHRRIELQITFKPQELRHLYETWFNKKYWNWGEDD